MPPLNRPSRCRLHKLLLLLWLLPGVSGAATLLVLDDRLEMSDSARIESVAGRHDLSTNATASQRVKLGDEARIIGDVYIGPRGNPALVVKLRDAASINGQIRPLDSRKSLPTVSPPNIAGNARDQRYDRGTTTLSGDLRVRKLHLKDTAVLHIRGHVQLYAEGNVLIENAAKITLDNGARLQLYVGGEIEVEDAASINAGGDPAAVEILVLSNKEVDLEGASITYARIVAPRSKLELENNALLRGSFIGTRATLTDSSLLQLYDTGDSSPALPTPSGDWHFDEGSWTGASNEVLDSSGNAHHGLARGSSTRSDGKLCAAGNFSTTGIGDYLNLPASPLHGAGDFTVAAWGRTQKSGQTTLLSAAGPRAYNEAILYFVAPGRFNPYLRERNIGSLNHPSLRDGQWHHIAWTRRGREHCLYIDGQRSSCRSGGDSNPIAVRDGGLIIAQEQDRLGGGFDASQAWDGDLDELLIFRQALSAAQISRIHAHQAAGENYDGSSRSCPAVTTSKPSCAAWLGDDPSLAGKDGLYWLDPDGDDGLPPFQAQCDMSTDGGGWTVIQQRQSRSDFYLDWADYKSGFGTPGSNHWLGNERIHALAPAEPVTLRIDMTRSNGDKRYAQYSRFAVGDEASGYRLTAQNYTGTAGNSLGYHHNRRFSTRDRDNDAYPRSCAQRFRGAWWYGACHHSNLNGVYHGGPHRSYADGVNWRHFAGYNDSLTATTMMLRGPYTPTVIAPLAEWRMDEARWDGTANEVEDSGSSGHNGRALGSIQTVPGLLCRAAEIPANTHVTPAQAVDTGLDLDTQLGSRGSIALWYKAERDWRGGGQRMLLDASEGDRFFFLLLDDQGRLSLNLEDRDDHDLRVQTSAGQNIAAGQWTHIAVSWDLSTKAVAIHVNGAPVTSQITDGGNPLGTQIANLGALYLGDNRNAYHPGGSNNSAAGVIDEVLVFDAPISRAQVATIHANQAAGNNHDGSPRSCPNYGPDHFRIAHDGHGIHCLAEAINVSAHNADGSITESYTGTLTLDTQTGKGSWRLLRGAGRLSDATSNDGKARYSFAAADLGRATFALDYPEGSASFDIDAYDGALRDDDREGQISFAASGFTVTASALPNPPPSSLNDPLGTQTAGSRFPLHLAAYGGTPGDAQCGVIETYAGSKTIQLSTTRINPAAGGISARGGGAINFVNGQAVISAQYKDAGQIRLSLSDGSISGGTTPFVVRPASLVISLSGAQQTAADHSGSVYLSAGSDFTTTVTAKDAEGDITPNFGNESPAEQIALSHALLAPAGGASGSLNGRLSKTGAGVFSGAINWSEVGIIRLDAAIADGDYLGSGKLQASLGNLGRFVPHRLVIDGLDHGALQNTCAAGGFSYTGQPFGYASAGQPSFVVSGQNAAGAITTNYRGNFAKLSSTSPRLPAVSADALQQGNGGAPLALSQHQAALALADLGDGSHRYTLGADAFSYTRNPLAQVGAFDVAPDMPISALIDADGVTATITPASPPTLRPRGVNLRYGRLRMENAHGSELQPLNVPVQLQLFDAGSGDFILHSADQCSSGLSLSITDLNPNDALDSSTLTATFNQPASGGRFELRIAAPGSGAQGNARLLIDAPSWLEFDWGLAGSPDPSAVATFGIYSGEPSLIYLQEVR